MDESMALDAVSGAKITLADQGDIKSLIIREAFGEGTAAVRLNKEARIRLIEMLVKSL